MSQYCVYMMASLSKVLYTGVTSDLPGRVYQHKTHATPGFTARYKCTQLVYYETSADVLSAIAREKQIKGWIRAKKLALVESMNPHWFDLGEGL